MSRLSHPYVLGLLGYMEVPRPVILTEYMPGGSLRVLLDARGGVPLPPLAQLWVALQVAEVSFLKVEPFTTFALDAACCRGIFSHEYSLHSLFMS